MVKKPDQGLVDLPYWYHWWMAEVCSLQSLGPATETVSDLRLAELLGDPSDLDKKHIF